MTSTSITHAARSRQAVQQRTLAVVMASMASQVFSGVGLAAGITVGALLAENMLDTTSLSGLPAALFTAGSATNLQARYAGTDLAHPTRRGRAVSTVLVATTLGAVAGPNLVAPTGELAEHRGIPALAGPFALAALAYGIAGIILFLLLRPDPLLAHRTDADRPHHEPGTRSRPPLRRNRHRRSGHHGPHPARQGRRVGWVRSGLITQSPRGFQIRTGPRLLRLSPGTASR